MGDLFKALSSGLGRFVYAWLMPSVVVTGLIYFLLLPYWPLQSGRASAGDSAARVNPVVQGASFLLVALTLSVVFAYCSRALYQFLEGYTMPRWLKRRLQKRMQRKFLQLRALTRSGATAERLIAAEQLKGFPERCGDVMPTRLGNALKAMESYGASRFGLDSQTLWYEMQSVAGADLKRDADETQGATDFFISAVAHLLLLSVAGVATFATSLQVHSLIIALVSTSLVYPAYRQAVKNVSEWRWTIQALVNTTRPALATALSLRLPPTHAEELKMWTTVSTLIHYGPDEQTLRLLDQYRLNAEASSNDDAKTSPLRRLQLLFRKSLRA